MEDAAIKHIIALCEDTQVPCHIVHLATGNAIRKHKYNFATYSKTINLPTAVFPIYPKFSSTPHKIWLYIHPKLDLRTSQNLVVYSTIIFIFFSLILGALEDAQNAGLPISVESCHHYLNLTSDKIPDANAEFKCCPPIREKWHREQLWNGIKRVGT